jgi:hypothetical protein
MEERIKANSEMVIQKLQPLSGIDFGYTQESVEWMEGYIERLRESGELETVEMKDKLASVLGSFLGECIIRSYGGSWKEHESGMWCVAFNEKDMAFPFVKVLKQMDNGLEDGIASFFSAIPIIFKDLAPRVSSIPKKPWWKNLTS